MFTAQTRVFIAVVNLTDNERGLDNSYVACCRAFSTIFNGEGNLLTFIQSFVAIALNSREVYEYIFATVVRSDKAKTGNDSNLLIVFYVQIMPDDFVMQLHRF